MHPEAKIFMWVGINAVLWGFVIWQEIKLRRPFAADDGHMLCIKSAIKSSFPRIDKEW